MDMLDSEYIRTVARMMCSNTTMVKTGRNHALTLPLLWKFVG